MNIFDRHIFQELSVQCQGNPQALYECIDQKIGGKVEQWVSVLEWIVSKKDLIPKHRGLIERVYKQLDEHAELGELRASLLLRIQSVKNKHLESSHSSAFVTFKKLLDERKGSKEIVEELKAKYRTEDFLDDGERIEALKLQFKENSNINLSLAWVLFPKLTDPDQFKFVIRSLVGTGESFDMSCACSLLRDVSVEISDSLKWEIIDFLLDRFEEYCNGTVSPELRSDLSRFLTYMPNIFRVSFANPQHRPEMVEVLKRVQKIGLSVGVWPFLEKWQPGVIFNEKDYELLHNQLNALERHPLREIPYLDSDQDKLRFIQELLADSFKGYDSVKFISKYFPKFQIRDPNCIVQLVKQCLNIDPIIVYKLASFGVSDLDLAMKRDILLQVAETDGQNLMPAIREMGFDWSQNDHLKLLEDLIPFTAQTRKDYVTLSWFSELGLQISDPRQERVIKMMIKRCAQHSDRVLYKLEKLGLMVGKSQERNAEHLRFVKEEVLPLIPGDYFYEIICRADVFGIHAKTELPLLRALIDNWIRSEYWLDVSQGFIDKLIKPIGFDPKIPEHAELILTIAAAMDPHCLVKAKNVLGLNEIDPKQIQGRFDQTIMKILNKNYSYLLDEELQEALSPLLSSADISVWKRSRPVLENWKAFLETPALTILTGEIKMSDDDDLRIMVQGFKKQVENLASQADEREMNGFSKVIRGIVNKLTLPKKLRELKKIHDEIGLLEQVKCCSAEFPRRIQLCVFMKEIKDPAKRYVNIIERLLIHLVRLEVLFKRKEIGIERHKLAEKNLLFIFERIERLYSEDHENALQVFNRLADTIHTVEIELREFPSYRKGQNLLYAAIWPYLNEDPVVRNKQLQILKQKIFQRHDIMTTDFARQFIKLLHTLEYEIKISPKTKRSVMAMFIHLAETSPKDHLVSLLNKRMMELLLLASVYPTDKDWNEKLGDLDSTELSEQFPHLIGEAMGKLLGLEAVDPVTFYEALSTTLFQWKNPQLFVAYAVYIRENHPSVLSALSEWILAVSKGPQAVHDFRYQQKENKKHWDHITDSNFLNKWTPEFKVKGEKLRESANIRQFDLIQFRKTLQTAIKDEVIQWDANVVAESMKPNLKEVEEPLAQLTTLKNYRGKLQGKFIHAVRALRLFGRLSLDESLQLDKAIPLLNKLRDQLRSLDKIKMDGVLAQSTLEFLQNTVGEAITDIKSSKGLKMPLHAAITDEPELVFRSGEDVVGSCQAASSQRGQNIGLVGYCAHGKNKMVGLWDDNKILIGRAIIKVSYDDEGRGYCVLQPSYFGKLDFPRNFTTRSLLATAREFCKRHDIPLVVPALQYKEALRDLGCDVKPLNKVLSSDRGLALYEYDDLTQGLISQDHFTYGLSGLVEVLTK